MRAAAPPVPRGRTGERPPRTASASSPVAPAALPGTAVDIGAPTVRRLAAVRGRVAFAPDRSPSAPEPEAQTPSHVGIHEPMPRACTEGAAGAWCDGHGSVGDVRGGLQCGGESGAGRRRQFGVPQGDVAHVGVRFVDERTRRVAGEVGVLDEWWPDGNSSPWARTSRSSTSGGVSGRRAAVGRTLRSGSSSSRRHASSGRSRQNARTRRNTGFQADDADPGLDVHQLTDEVPARVTDRRVRMPGDPAAHFRGDPVPAKVYGGVAAAVVNGASTTRPPTARGAAGDRAGRRGGRRGVPGHPQERRDSARARRASDGRGMSYGQPGAPTAARINAVRRRGRSRAGPRRWCPGHVRRSPRP